MYFPSHLALFSPYQPLAHVNVRLTKLSTSSPSSHPTCTKRSFLSYFSRPFLASTLLRKPTHYIRQALASPLIHTHISTTLQLNAQLVKTQSHWDGLSLSRKLPKSILDSPNIACFHSETALCLQTGPRRQKKTNIQL